MRRLSSFHSLAAAFFLLLSYGTPVFADCPNLCNPSWWKSFNMDEKPIMTAINENPLGVDQNGKTVLMYISQYGLSYKEIKLDLEKGADVNARDKNGVTALMYAADHDLQMVNWLVIHGADVNARSIYGESAIIDSGGAVGWDGRVTIYLLKHGAHANDKFQNNLTALYLAASNSTTNPAVKALIKAGADVNIQLNDKAKNAAGRTPLIAASMLHRLDNMRDLISAGATLDNQDHFGMTALMWAAYISRKGSKEAVKILLDAGANAKLRSTEGKTAFDYAKSNPRLVGSPVYWRLNDAQF